LYSLPLHPPGATRFPYTTLFRSVCSTRPNSLAATTMPTDWACLTDCFLNSAVYSCFGIFFTSLPSGLDANHRPLEDEKRRAAHRSEEHTSELQSRENLVCRLLLE